MGVIKKHIIYTWLGAVALMLLLFSICVDCVSNPTVTLSTLTQTEVSLIEDTCKDINELIYENSRDTGITDPSTQMLKASRDTNSPNTNGQMIENVEFNVSTYNRLEQLEKQEVMEIILTGIDNSQLSQISKSKIYNFVSNSDKSTSNLVRQLSGDVRADFASAYSSFRPFTGVLGWILGVFTLLIFIILGLTIVVDLAYIVIPFVQNGLSNENASAKPRFISPEAWNAVRVAEQSIGSNYREPVGVYFKSKTKQFIAIGICLLYLVSGKIYDLIAMVIDMFQGFLG